MAVRFSVDLSYGGLTCRHPFHPDCETLWGGYLYKLTELHGWLGHINDYRLPTARVIGVGRNVYTFDATRRWACGAIREHGRRHPGPMAI